MHAHDSRQPVLSSTSSTSSAARTAWIESGFLTCAARAEASAATQTRSKTASCRSCDPAGVCLSAKSSPTSPNAAAFGARSSKRSSCSSVMSPAATLHGCAPNAATAKGVLVASSARRFLKKPSTSQLTASIPIPLAAASCKNASGSSRNSRWKCMSASTGVPSPAVASTCPTGAAYQVLNGSRSFCTSSRPQMTRPAIV